MAVSEDLLTINSFADYLETVPKSQYEVSIIFPTYNERKNLPLLVKRMSKSLKGIRYEVIIVDDNSPDGTGKIADELAEKLTNLKSLHRANKKGLASAVIYGLKHARAKVVCVIDADLQHPPEKIPELLGEIEKGADIAIAKRYLKKDKRSISKGRSSYLDSLSPKPEI